MERKFRLQFETNHPYMIGHTFAMYRSDPQLDRAENQLSLYVPRTELPHPPPPVIRITLEWTDKNSGERYRRQR